MTERQLDITYIPFLRFVEKTFEFPLKRSIDFWEDKDVRLAFYRNHIVAEAAEMFDTCLHMHEFGQYKHWFKYLYNEEYLSGAHTAEIGELFIAPVSYPTWLGWVMFWKNTTNLPFPPATLWDIYCTVIHMMPDEVPVSRHNFQ